MLARRIFQGLTAFCVLLATVSPLLAAEEAAHHEGGGEHAATTGLPQFDPSTFPSQIFWLGVAFVILYAFFNKRALPEIASVLDNRREHIQGDLETSERLRTEADSVQNAYETSLDRARADSSRLMTGVHQKIQASSAERLARFHDKAGSDIAALEARLSKAKTEAMGEMNTIAAEVAVEAARRIVGISTDMDQVRTVMQSISKKEAA